MGSDAIEKIDGTKRRRPVDYDYLFEMQQRIEENQSLEVEDIIFNVCSKDREIQFGRKVAHLNSRWLSQDYQTATSDEKVAIMRRKECTYLNGVGVACQVAAAIFGGHATIYGGIFSASAHGFSETAKRLDQVKDSNKDVLHHSYQRAQGIVGDHTQNAQSAEREHEQDQATIDRLWQTNQRLAEMILGGG